MAAVGIPTWILLLFLFPFSGLGPLLCLTGATFVTAGVVVWSERRRGRGAADKARLLAGAALEADPEALTWSNGGWAAGDGSDPAQVKTVEDIALYAHGTGALPPGVEGGLDAQAVYGD